MAKPLDNFVGFDDLEVDLEDVDFSVLNRPHQSSGGHPRLDLEYMTARTAMFINMTQGAGKPMTYGAQKKDKR